MKHKKVILIAAAAVIGAAVIGTIVVKSAGSGNSDEGNAYVQPVSTIVGQYNGLGLSNRFGGIVESEETTDIKLDSDKTVKNLFVEAGQTVEAGTPLFEYDVDEMNLNLQQAKLELERINNEISQGYSQIKTLEGEKSNVSGNELLEYTLQIQNIQNNVKRAEYNKNAKELEIDHMQKNIDNAAVKSPISGVVKSINTDPNVLMNNNNVYITILSSGDFRVKATTNEQNIYAISEGEIVTVRSRVNSEQTWHGSITKIDNENPVTEQNSDKYMYDSMNSGGSQSATKYNFYISLDSYENLMMGQHVYVEIGDGETKQKEGIWIPSFFITMDEQPWVWAADKRDKLKKQPVEIGEYDGENDSYEILSGLTMDDYISFPDETLVEGTKVIKEGGESKQ